VAGVIPQPVLQPDSFGDVADVDDDAGDARVVEQVGRDQFQRSAGSVGMANLKLSRDTGRLIIDELCE